MLSRYFSRLVRSYVERQIKSALTAAQFTNVKEDNLKDLLSWLAVASGGKYEQQCLNYTFLNEQALFDYAIEVSNQALTTYKSSPWTFFERLLPDLYRKRRRTRLYLMQSQSVIVNVLKAAHPLQRDVSKLSYWKRFLSRRLTPPAPKPQQDQSLFKIFLQKLLSNKKPSSSLSLSAPPVEEEKQAPLVREPKANFPSSSTKKHPRKETPLREEYTPDELLERPDILERRMNLLYASPAPIPLTIADNPPVKEEKNAVPTHLRSWLASPLPFIQEINIDETQNQQRVDTQTQAREQKQNIDFENMLALASDRYIDSSQKIKLLKTEKTDSIIGDVFKRKLHQQYPGKEIVLSISPAAEELLGKYDIERVYWRFDNPTIKETKSSSDLPSSSAEDYFTLKNIPRGIFIVPEKSEDKNTIQISICFCEELRKDQEKNEDHVLFLDPVKKIKPAHEWYASPYVYLGLNLSNCSISFRENQRQFLRDNSRYIEYAIAKLAREKRFSSQAVFLDFIDRLKNLENRKISIPHKLDLLHEEQHDNPFSNLFQFYVYCFFRRDISLHITASLNKILEALPAFTDEELEFLCLLSEVNCNLEEAWKVFNYFLGSFKARDLLITKEFIQYLKKKFCEYSSRYRLFFSLSLILDCLSLSPLPDFQARLLCELPQALGPATELLREGYSFIHQSMMPEGLDHSTFFSCQDINEMIVDSYENLKSKYFHYHQYSCASMCRALYLRYLAASVATERVEEAFNQWEKQTGQALSANSPEELSALDDILMKQWPSLSEYLFSLPTRLSAPPPRIESAFINQAKRNEQKATYLEKDIDVLLSKLGLEAELKSHLKITIEKINQKEEKYSSCTPQELMTHCERLKTPRESKEECSIDTLSDCLCVLREVYYRSSYNSSQATPKVGKWLRLEQLVAILLASPGQQERLLQNETSEGKTLIISFIAIIHALQGEKVDVLTHNESMAKEGAAHLRALFQCLNLTVASEKSSVKEIQKADIYFVDASTAVIDDLLAGAVSEHEKSKLAGARQATIALIDEVDNIAIDIHANTTMQISTNGEKKEDEAHKKEMEVFIRNLNTIVRDKLVHEDKIISPADQTAFVKHHLTLIPDFIDLSYWVKAAISALSLKKDEDYVVEDDQVRIVHKKTTGRVDKKSQWGNGVHHCVAAWEKSSDPSVKIPGFSEIIAEGDVENYLKKYTKRYGFTGTLGEGSVVKAMKEVVGITEEPVIMPRAKRPAPADANWPIPPAPPVEDEKNEAKDEIKYEVKRIEPPKARPLSTKKSIMPLEKTKPKKEYDYDQLPKLHNRSYPFREIFVEDRQSHNDTLLEFLTRAKEKEFSTLVQFTTIEECEKFAALLRSNSFNNIQILDDKKEQETKEKSRPHFRPSEAVAIARAKEPRMITLTTAAGGRAIDYQSVNISVQAKPSLKRVERQQKDRVGRNGEFGTVYEIYCIKDLDEIAQRKWQEALKKGVAEEKEQDLANAPLQITPQRVILDEMQERLQKVDLDTIATQRPLKQLKNKIQREYTTLLKEQQKDIASHRGSWCSFYKSVAQEKNVDALEKRWAAFKASLSSGG